MSNSSKFLAFLLLSISSLAHSASEEGSSPIPPYLLRSSYKASAQSFVPSLFPKTLQFCIKKDELVYHPKTGALIPGFTRSEFHQSTGIGTDGFTLYDSAKITRYTRTDGSLVKETVALYPDQKIGKLLDVFHTATPDAIKNNVVIIAHYMKTQAPGSDGEVLAKIAMIRILGSIVPTLTKTLISGEKQKDAMQDLDSALKKLATTDAKYIAKFIKAQAATQSKREDLALIYDGFGSIECKDDKESKQAALLGKKVVTYILSDLAPFIQAAKAAEALEESSKKGLH